MTIFEKTTIMTNRGDKLAFTFSIPLFDVDGNPILEEMEEGQEPKQKFYEFKKGDTLTFGVYSRKGMSKDAYLLKEFIVDTPTTKVNMSFTGDEMKIGPLIDKPTEYWYEIQLNKDQTILGYDQDGAKIIKLYPEGSDIPFKKEEIEV